MTKLKSYQFSTKQTNTYHILETSSYYVVNHALILDKQYIELVTHRDIQVNSLTVSSANYINSLLELSSNKVLSKLQYTTLQQGHRSVFIREDDRELVLFQDVYVNFLFNNERIKDIQIKQDTGNRYNPCFIYSNNTVIGIIMPMSMSDKDATKIETFINRNYVL